MENAPAYLNAVTREDVTIIDDDSFDLDLVLRKGNAQTRVVNCIAVQIGENDQIENEIKFQAEFPLLDLDTWNVETDGMSQNDVVRKYTLCVWDWPLANGKRTTREQFSPGMLNKLLKETYISTSLFGHLIAVRDGGRVKDIHRHFRKGN